MRGANGDYALFLRPHVVPHRGFDYFLHETFRHHAAAVALAPVFAAGGEPSRTPFEQGQVPPTRLSFGIFMIASWTVSAPEATPRRASA